MVRPDDRRHLPTRGHHERSAGHPPPHHRSVFGHVLHQETEQRQSRQVHLVGRGAVTDVVAEDSGDLVGVGVTADPCQQVAVVDDRALFALQTNPVSQPAGNDRRPEHVLHRLAQSEVESQRQRRNDLRTTWPSFGGARCA